MKKLLAIVIVLRVAVLMALTRPAEEKHKEAMMKAVKEYVDEEAEERGFSDNGITRLGKTIVTKAIETALDSKLQMHDYILLNTSTVRLNGEDKTLSLGLLGHVFTFDKDMLREKLQEATQTKEVESVKKAAAKEEAKELKRQLKEQRKQERAAAKEAKRKAKEAEKEAKRKAKEAEKEAKRKAKEAAKQQ